MTRVKRGVMVKARHKKVVKAAKGFRGQRSRIFTQAKQALMRAGLNSYRSRKLKKRQFRSLWSSRISAAIKPLGLNYSRLISTLFKKQVLVNRKMLSEVAFQYPEAFENLVKKVK